MGQARIGAKNLGLMALEDFCPRCFWYLIRVNFRVPFDKFPGVFSTIDRYEKRVLEYWLDLYNKAPDWLGHFKDANGLPQGAAIVLST